MAEEAAQNPTQQPPAMEQPINVQETTPQNPPQRMQTAPNPTQDGTLSRYDELQDKLMNKKITKQELKELKSIEKNEMEIARQMSLKEEEDRNKLLEAEEE